MNDDIELYWEERGHGEPLLLLHGFTGLGADWAHVFDLDALARDHRVIVPDLRGHGRSPKPKGELTHRGIASDVLALLDRIGVARYKAIGTSLGSNALLHMATRAPERAETLVLVAPWPRFPEAARETVERAGLRTDMSFTPELLGSIRARTLIVNGDRDPFLPVSLMVEAYQAIPDAELWIVPGGGHGPIYERWRETFVRVAREFLSLKD